MNAYAKFGAALVATILSGILAALTGDQVIDPVEWVNIAAVGVGAVGVLYFPNVPSAPAAKAVVAALLAVLALLANLILGGLDFTEILQLLIAGLSAVGVYAVKNSPYPASGRHAADAA